MKKLLYLSIAFIGLLVFPISNVNAQGVGINPSGNNPDPSAMFDVSSTTKGQLMPRMTTTQRGFISSPANGLMIYNTDCNTFNYYNGGSWIALGNTGSVSTPGTITGLTTPCQNATGVTYSIVAVTGATGYNWIVPSGTTIISGQGTTSITVNFGTNNGNICVSASNACGTSNVSCATITLATTPTAPTAATNTITTTQIVWNWNAVSGATGYKYSTANNYSNATDNGTGTSYTQTGLTCNMAYTLYVWDYNACGSSLTSTTLTQTTSACPVPCTWNGSFSFSVTHTAGSVAPITKTVTYNQIQTSLSGVSKCWITQNFGADQQAASETDNIDAAAGWYWQFNRKQGYKVGPTPAWTVTSINETSDWLPANDPCTILLGTGWRIPTYTEWNNVFVNGAWVNSTDAYNSVLKLHQAGFLVNSNGALSSRGSTGRYRSSTQYDATNGWNMGLIFMNFSDKAHGFSLRCLKD